MIVRQLNARFRPFGGIGIVRRKVAATAATNVFLALIGGVGGVLLARVLGTSARGDLVVVAIWPAILGTFAAMGLTSATCYWISREPDQAPDFLTLATAGGVASGLLLAALGVSIAPHIGSSNEVHRYLLIMLLLSPIYLVAGVWVAALQAVDILRWNLARSLQPVVYLLLTVALIVAHRLTLASASLALGASTVCSLGTLVFMRRAGLAFTASPDAAYLARLYRYGVRVCLSSVPQTVNVTLDVLVLSITPGVSSRALANYAVAVSLSTLAIPLSLAFGSVAFPQVARTAVERDRRRIERHALLGSFTMAVAVVAIICAIAPFAVPRVFGSGFRAAVPALWLLAPGTVVLCVGLVVEDVLRGRGQPTFVTLSECIGAVITLVALPIAVPRFGINAAAAISSFAYITVAAVLLALLSHDRTNRSIELDPGFV